MAYEELTLVLTRGNGPYAIVVSLAYFFPTKLNERKSARGIRGMMILYYKQVKIRGREARNF